MRSAGLSPSRGCHRINLLHEKRAKKRDFGAKNGPRPNALTRFTSQTTGSRLTSSTRFENHPILIVQCHIPEWYRDKIQQKCGLPIEAWEAKNGKKLEDGLYRGTLRRGGHHAGCGCAVGEQGEEVHIQPITGT